jgi:hypothetical protein
LGASVVYSDNKHDSYEEMLAATHRRNAPRARPPFVTCHLAFWNPLELTSASEAEAKRLERKQRLDNYLKRIWENLQNRKGEGISSPDTPNRFGDLIFLFASYFRQSEPNGALNRYDPKEPDDNYKRTPGAHRTQLVTYNFFWWGARATLRWEQHTEYVALTMILDLSPAKTDKAMADFERDEPEGVYDLWNNIKKLNEKVSSSDYAIKFDGTTDTDGSPIDRYTALHKALYDRVWNKFFDIVLLKPHDDETPLKDIFADFRGLCVGSANASTKSKDWLAFGKPFWRVNDTRIAAPDSVAARGLQGGDDPTADVKAVETEIWKKIAKKKAREITDWQAVLNRFWPFVTATVENIDFLRQELTASTMLGGNALYASSLGAQPPHAQHSGRFPVYYLLAVDSLNGWQIGRLIDRLHQLGTFRLAGLIKFGDIRDAAYSLNGIEVEINKARNLIGKPISLTNEARESRERLRQLTLDIIKIDGELGALTERFKGDIGYRLSRSRLYIEQFREGTKSLRIGRIEGFQPYHVFVERRLGEAFNFISMVAGQYQRVMSDRTALAQRYSTLLDQTAGLETRDRNTQIEVLQKVGEYALISCLLPYYAASILTNILFSGSEGAAAHTGRAPPVQYPVVWKMPAGLGSFEILPYEIWSAALAIGLLGVVLRIYFGARKDIHERARSIFKFVLGTLRRWLWLIALISVLALIYRFWLHR